MKLIMTVEVEVDDIYWRDVDAEGLAWLRDTVLGDEGELVLVSRHVGDEVGPVRVLSIDSEAPPAGATT